MAWHIGRSQIWPSSGGRTRSFKCEKLPENKGFSFPGLAMTRLRVVAQNIALWSTAIIGIVQNADLGSFAAAAGVPWVAPIMPQSRALIAAMEN